MSGYLTTPFGSDRRRRLRLALEPLIAPQQLWHALWVWEREFAERSPFDVSGFASRLAEELGSPGSDKALLDQITAGIQAPVEGLPSDPIEEMLRNPYRPQQGSAPANQPTRSPSPMSPPDVIFNEVLKAVVDTLTLRLPHGGADAVRREVGQLVGSAGGNAGAWVSDASAKLMGLGPQQMAAVINGLYVWTCEELGPVAADPIFSSAVRTAEGLPEAASFSPRRLL